jgi:2-polyprenyl-3-methyl-5-hydroxy-6-metoxy-1,4-benzoquinol methylase
MAVARYDAIAGYYTARFDNTDDPAAVAFLDLVGPVAGQRVLDVACGHGRMARELARRGAGVTGIDISGTLIGTAAEIERASPLGVGYIHADVTQPGPLGSARYDICVCSFGLSDIDDLRPALAAVSRALRPGGRFVFSVLHPCFGGGPDIAGSWPTAARYYDEGRWTAREARSGLRRQVGATHRMLSTYLNTLRQHGLWLDRVAEPEPQPGWDPAHVADRQPVFLAARCLKLAGPEPPRA